MRKELVKRDAGLMPVVFSDDMARSMARILRIKPEHTDKFRAAYSLLPLSRAKECIDLAYQMLLDDGDVEAIASWLTRYDRASGKILPEWAKKNSRDYLDQARKALKEGRGSSEAVLFEFKGFIYAVFCRRLIEYYSEVSNGKSTAKSGKS